jgi:hypothetical protein
MNLLLENWRQFINEQRITNSRGDFTCPEKGRGGSVYYDVDRDNPPTIEEIAKCYTLNNAKVTERSVSGLNPALYNTEELTKFREYDKEDLRRDDASFEELKADIKENGIKEELIIFFGRNGKVHIGEGNHRHQIALELGIDKIPVRFIFWRSVEGNSPYGKAYKVVDVPSEDDD